MNTYIYSIVNTLCSPALRRVLVAVFGGFIVALSLSAALAHIFLSEGMKSQADAFYWSSFIAFIVYVIAMIWAFAAGRLSHVLLAFIGVTCVCVVIVSVLGGDARFGYSATVIQTLILILVVLAQWFGFGALALSQNKHWKTVMQMQTCPYVTSRALRGLGAVLLATSFILLVIRDGVAFGVLLWPMVAFFVAILVAFMIAYRPISIRNFAQDIYVLTTDPRDEHSYEI